MVLKRTVDRAPLSDLCGRGTTSDRCSSGARTTTSTSWALGSGFARGGFLCSFDFRRSVGVEAREEDNVS
jgi:hypothetical protein